MCFKWKLYILQTTNRRKPRCYFLCCLNLRVIRIRPCITCITCGEVLSVWILHHVRSMLIVAPWCRGYHYYTTSFNKAWTRFCASSNPALGVSEIRNGEDLWQWSRQEIRLNAFRRSTVPQKQFIIIIIIIIIITIKGSTVTWVLKQFSECLLMFGCLAKIARVYG